MANERLQKHAEKLRESFEKLCLVVVSLFAFLPFFAVFEPIKHGNIFSFFSIIAIISAMIALWVYLHNYYHVFRVPGGVGKTEYLWNNLKTYFAKNKHALLFLIIYICVILSCLFAKDKSRALFGMETRPDGLFLHTALMILFVFSSFIQNPKYRKIIYSIYIISFLIQGIIMIQQHCGILGAVQQEPFGKLGGKLRFAYVMNGIATGHFFEGNTGSFYNPNHLGYYIGMCAMLGVGLFIKAKKPVSKIFSALFIGYAFWILVLNNSFGVYLAVLAAVIIIGIATCFIAKGKITTAFAPLAIFIIVSIVVSFVTTSDSLVIKNFIDLGNDVSKITNSDDSTETSGEEDLIGNGRWESWIQTLQMIGEKPIFGYGPDNLKDEYTKRGVGVDRAHNEPLERAVSTGIFSGVCYVGALLYLILTRLKRKDHLEDNSMLIPLGIVVAYTISALVGVFVFYTVCHYFIFLGMLTDK